MDLTPSDEQRLLRESVDRFINEAYDSDHRRRTASDPLGFSRQIWKQFAELGWLALPVAEAHGGLGAGAVETGILMEAFGRGLVAEPYLATVVIGAGLIAECGGEAQKQAMLPSVADGSLLLAFAHSERAARFISPASRRPQARPPTAGGSTATRPRCSTAMPRTGSSSPPASPATMARRAICACSWCRQAPPA
jgi:alkylation response protein AidB-like acyl-CoA dehydrogenase